MEEGGRGWEGEGRRRKEETKAGEKKQAECWRTYGLSRPPTARLLVRRFGATPCCDTSGRVLIVLAKEKPMLFSAAGRSRPLTARLLVRRLAATLCHGTSCRVFVVLAKETPMLGLSLDKCCRTLGTSESVFHPHWSCALQCKAGPLAIPSRLLRGDVGSRLQIQRSAPQYSL